MFKTINPKAVESDSDFLILFFIIKFYICAKCFIVSWYKVLLFQYSGLSDFLLNQDRRTSGPYKKEKVSYS